jgi:hypothetical protein
MTLTSRQIQQVVSRHFEDPADRGRSCRACGRPWPCDVRQIALALGWTPERPLEAAPYRPMPVPVVPAVVRHIHGVPARPAMAVKSGAVARGVSI